VVAYITRPTTPIWGVGFLLSVSLYIFAFLDAYYDALEYNAGLSTYLIGSSPRIACVLNFLTNGIGYFYLGERAKGLILFIGLGFLRQALTRQLTSRMGISLVWFVLQIVFAGDAYRLARKQLLQSFPEQAGYSWKSGETNQMSPVLPVVLALILILTLFAFMILGIFAQGASGIQPDSGTTFVTPQGNQYVNRAIGLKILFPPNWVVEANAEQQLQAANSDRSCKAILLRQATIVSPEEYQRGMEKILEHQPGFSVYGHAAATLAGRHAALVRAGAGTNVSEEIYSARKGMSLYTLILVSGADECTAPLAGIRESLQLHP
jgi:hypothetical protein